MEEWFRALSRTEQLILSNLELEYGPPAFHFVCADVGGELGE